MFRINYLLSIVSFPTSFEYLNKNQSNYCILINIIVIPFTGFLATDDTPNFNPNSIYPQLQFYVVT